MPEDLPPPGDVMQELPRPEDLVSTRFSLSELSHQIVEGINSWVNDIRFKPLSAKERLALISAMLDVPVINANDPKFANNEFDIGWNTPTDLRAQSVMGRIVMDRDFWLKESGFRAQRRRMTVLQKFHEQITRIVPDAWTDRGMTRLAKKWGQHDWEEMIDSLDNTNKVDAWLRWYEYSLEHEAAEGGGLSASVKDIARTFRGNIVKSVETVLGEAAVKIMPWEWLELDKSKQLGDMFVRMDLEGGYSGLTPNDAIAGQTTPVHTPEPSFDEVDWSTWDDPDPWEGPSGTNDPSTYEDTAHQGTNLECCIRTEDGNACGTGYCGHMSVFMMPVLTY